MYQSQTYPNRELLIVADGDNVADLVLDDPNVRYFHIDQRTIGAKRNFGCEQARGDLIAHWDDDDYSAPNRLSFQVRMLQDSGKAVCGFRTIRFTDGKRWWLYSGAQNYAVGTSLVYRRSWWQSHRFPDMQVGEDTAFAWTAKARRQIVVADAGDLMIATIHPGNTSPRTDVHKWKEL